VTPHKRGNGDPDPAWDEVPLLEGDSERAGENLPLFEPTARAEEPRAPERHRGSRRAETAARPPRGESDPVPADRDVWVQSTLDAAPPPAPAAAPARAAASTEGEAPASRAPLPSPRLSERWLAGLADCVLHVAVIAGGLVAESLLGLQPGLRQWPGFLVFLLAFSFLYTTVPLAFWGTTPGMAWRGLRARDGERPLHFGQTALRWVGALATVALAGLPLLLSFGGRSLADRLSDSQTFADAS
jgi:hypothetical protein